MKNTFLGNHGPEKDYTNFGATFLYEPNDRFEALLTVETYDDGSDIGVATNQNRPGWDVCDRLGACMGSENSEDTFSTDTNNPSQYDTDAVTLNMKFQINDNLQLAAIAGWRDEEEDYLSDLDGTSENYLSIDNDNLHEQKSLEVRLEGSYDKFDFVAGAYIWESEYEQNWVTFGSFWSQAIQPIGPMFAFNIAGMTDACLAEVIGALRCYQGVGFGSAGLGDMFTQLLHQNQEVNSEALFFQGNYHINDQWTVTLGVRHTKEEKAFFAAQSYLVPLGLERLPVSEWAVNLAGETDVFDNSTDWSETTPKVGVDYKFNDDIMFYASYSEGFHSGGYFGRNQNAADFANTYEPEFAESWEVGMKSQFFSNTVQLNVAAFFNDFEGKQEATVKVDSSTSTVVTVIDNVGAVDYTGIEFEARWLVNENFNLFATYGWLDAEYTDFCIDLDGTTTGAGQTSDCGVVELAGQNTLGEDIFLAPQNQEHLTPKYAPEFTFGIGGTYTIPIGEGNLDIHARYNIVGDQETALDNANPAKEADFVHASVSYETERYRVSVYGRNLTDEIRESIQPVTPYAQRGYSEPGRSWGLEFAMNF